MWVEGGAEPVELPPPMPLDELVRRYLAAFGPATVKDVQTWSGLSRLAAVVAAMGDELVHLVGEDGAELHDLPDAPRPGADVDAPVRLLGEFDNLILSHADRRRVIPEADRTRLSTLNGMQPATVLIDGEVAGTWRIDEDGRLGDPDGRGRGRPRPGAPAPGWRPRAAGCSTSSRPTAAHDVRIIGRMTATRVVVGDITRLDEQGIAADAIVNAANERLAAGSGVCGAIFAAAGHRELAAACAGLGGCPTGSAVATPAFALGAHGVAHVIHAVGPVFAATSPEDADALLASAYRSAARRRRGARGPHGRHPGHLDRGLRLPRAAGGGHRRPRVHDPRGLARRGAPRGLRPRHGRRADRGPRLGLTPCGSRSPAEAAASTTVDAGATTRSSQG